jgi:hypothetical protein
MYELLVEDQLLFDRNLSTVQYLDQFHLYWGINKLYQIFITHNSNSITSD